MPSPATKQPYIHGFSAPERFRLVAQAAVLAPAVFSAIELEETATLLEIGCGVGAQTRHLLDRWPHLSITGIDRNASHLASAAEYLGDDIAAGRVTLLDANAEQLPFTGQSFEAALTIWVLEHAAHPERILKEALKVLVPGGSLILNEVDNATFGFTPENAVIQGWWDKFNDLQRRGGADPFIGQRLGQLVAEAGFENVTSEPLHLISSQREPDRRLTCLRYLRDLLLSGAAAMQAAGLVDENEREQLRQEFLSLESRPEVDFQYFAIRVSANSPATAA